jgi:hypothetical protein
MIDYETFCQIRLLAGEKNLKASQIAAELSLDIKTVEKWMSRQAFEPRKKTPLQGCSGVFSLSGIEV